MEGFAADLFYRWPVLIALLLGGAQCSKDQPAQSTGKAWAQRAPASQKTKTTKPILAPVTELVHVESVSIGSVSNGSLRNAAALPDFGPGFFQNPKRPNPRAGYGTYELVASLVKAGAALHREFPQRPAYINDLGFEHGGPIDHHGSHQAGRDVDVLFFITDKDGNSIEPKGIPFDPHGEGWDFGDLKDPTDDVFVRFDADRTWAFVQGFLEAANHSVQRIFVVEHLRTLLLQAAKRSGAPVNVIELAEAVMCQPSVAHDDHLHFRLYCASDDIKEGCRDNYPLYPWHLNALRELGAKPVIATRAKKKSRTVSAKEARERAGKVHPKVEAFLARQAKWSTNPHPGRRWCP